MLNIIISQGKSYTYEVVMKLLKNYIDKGHFIILDKFYKTCWTTRPCGTLHTNRKSPRSNPGKKKTTGETNPSREHVPVMKWCDKRKVLTISTTHGSQMLNVVIKRGVVRRNPCMVIAYNKGMSGINRSDQMISYYTTSRKSCRWYMKTFSHIMDVALWNSQNTHHDLSISLWS